MATIAENIQTIANGIDSIKTNLGLPSTSSLANVVTKSGQVIEPTGTINITENGTVDVTNYASANVNVSGGGGLEIKDVNFFDYDGTLLYSYTLAEIMNMTELPEGPTHTGLVFQEWNWTLADIKTNNGPLDVGATYTTASGATEFDIIVNSYIGMTITFSNFTGVTSIDWGDGTTDNNLSHTYQERGYYTIKVYGITQLPSAFVPSGGTLKFLIKRIRLANIQQLNTYAISDDNANNLESITISNSLKTISSSNFKSLPVLGYIVFPKSITSFSSKMPQSCYSLKGLSIPKSITNATMVYSNYCIERITIPKSYTSIPSNFIYNAYKLKYVKFPNTITSISGNNSLQTRQPIIYDFSDFSSIPSLTSVTSGFILMADIKIVVPDNLYANWIVATNWVTFAGYIYKASEVEL